MFHDVMKSRVSSKQLLKPEDMPPAIPSSFNNWDLTLAIEHAVESHRPAHYHIDDIPSQVPLCYKATGNVYMYSIRPTRRVVSMPNCGVYGSNNPTRGIYSNPAHGSSGVPHHSLSSQQSPSTSPYSSVAQSGNSSVGGICTQSGMNQHPSSKTASETQRVNDMDCQPRLEKKYPRVSFIGRAEDAPKKAGEYALQENREKSAEYILKSEESIPRSVRTISKSTESTPTKSISKSTESIPTRTVPKSTMDTQYGSNKKLWDTSLARLSAISKNKAMDIGTKFHTKFPASKPIPPPLPEKDLVVTKTRTGDKRIVRLNRRAVSMFTSMDQYKNSYPGMTPSSQQVDNDESELAKDHDNKERASDEEIYRNQPQNQVNLESHNEVLESPKIHQEYQVPPLSGVSFTNGNSSQLSPHFANLTNELYNGNIGVNDGRLDVGIHSAMNISPMPSDRAASRIVSTPELHSVDSISSPYYQRRYEAMRQRNSQASDHNRSITFTAVPEVKRPSDQWYDTASESSKQETLESESTSGSPISPSEQVYPPATISSFYSSSNSTRTGNSLGVWQNNKYYEYPGVLMESQNSSNSSKYEKLKDYEQVDPVSQRNSGSLRVPGIRLVNSPSQRVSPKVNSASSVNTPQEASLKVDSASSVNSSQSSQNVYSTTSVNSPSQRAPQNINSASAVNSELFIDSVSAVNSAPFVKSVSQGYSQLSVSYGNSTVSPKFYRSKLFDVHSLGSLILSEVFEPPAPPMPSSEVVDRIRDAHQRTLNLEQNLYENQLVRARTMIARDVTRDVLHEYPSKNVFHDDEDSLFLDLTDDSKDRLISDVSETLKHMDSVKASGILRIVKEYAQKSETSSLWLEEGYQPNYYRQERYSKDSLEGQHLPNDQIKDVRPHDTHSPGTHSSERVSNENFGSKRVSNENFGSKRVSNENLSGSKRVSNENLSGSERVSNENLSGSERVSNENLSGSERFSGSGYLPVSGHSQQYDDEGLDEFGNPLCIDEDTSPYCGQYQRLHLGNNLHDFPNSTPNPSLYALEFPLLDALGIDDDSLFSAAESIAAKEASVDDFHRYNDEYKWKRLTTPMGTLKSVYAGNTQLGRGLEIPMSGEVNNRVPQQEVGHEYQLNHSKEFQDQESGEKAPEVPEKEVGKVPQLPDKEGGKAPQLPDKEFVGKAPQLPDKEGGKVPQLPDKTHHNASPHQHDAYWQHEPVNVYQDHSNENFYGSHNINDNTRDHNTHGADHTDIHRWLDHGSSGEPKLQIAKTRRRKQSSIDTDLSNKTPSPNELKISMRTDHTMGTTHTGISLLESKGEMKAFARQRPFSYCLDGTGQDYLALRFPIPKPRATSSQLPEKSRIVSTYSPPTGLI